MNLVVRTPDALSRTLELVSSWGNFPGRWELEVKLVCAACRQPITQDTVSLLRKLEPPSLREAATALLIGAIATGLGRAEAERLAENCTTEGGTFGAFLHLSTEVDETYADRMATAFDHLPDEPKLAICQRLESIPDALHEPIRAFALTIDDPGALVSVATRLRVDETLKAKTQAAASTEPELRLRAHLLVQLSEWCGHLLPETVPAINEAVEFAMEHRDADGRASPHRAQLNELAHLAVRAARLQPTLVESAASLADTIDGLMSGYAFEHAMLKGIELVAARSLDDAVDLINRKGFSAAPAAARLFRDFRAEHDEASVAAIADRVLDHMAAASGLWAAAGPADNILKAAARARALQIRESGARTEALLAMAPEERFPEACSEAALLEIRDSITGPGA